MAFRVLLATRNQGKVKEFTKLFGSVPGLEIVSLDSLPPLPEVVEDGDTFEQNAAKKARQLAQAAGMPALADDSGLEVDALDGAPGVFSARFAGPGATDADNNHKLLSLMADVPDARRTARFRCVLALATPDSPNQMAAPPATPPDGTCDGWVRHQDTAHQCWLHLEDGACEGRVVREPRGDHGFGYDPIFVPEGHTRTMAELAPEQKNLISHRARAAQQMAEFLRGCLPRRFG